MLISIIKIYDILELVVVFRVTVITFDHMLHKKGG